MPAPSLVLVDPARRRFAASLQRLAARTVGASIIAASAVVFLRALGH